MDRCLDISIVSTDGGENYSLSRHVVVVLLFKSMFQEISQNTLLQSYGSDVHYGRIQSGTMAPCHPFPKPQVAI